MLNEARPARRTEPPRATVVVEGRRGAQRSPGMQTEARIPDGAGWHHDSTSEAYPEGVNAATSDPVPARAPLRPAGAPAETVEPAGGDEDHGGAARVRALVDEAPAVVQVDLRLLLVAVELAFHRLPPPQT